MENSAPAGKDGWMADYCTNTEIKAALPDGNWGSSYDILLATLATRASRAIDLFLGRQPNAFAASSDETRYFDGEGRSSLWVGELAAAPTSVAVDEAGDGNYTTWEATDIILWPYNAALNGEPYLRLDINPLGNKTIFPAFPKAVKIVGKFGYATAVPEIIKMATIIQAVRWFKRGQQGFEDTGAVAELGQLKYVQGLDPDVAEMIMYLRRIGI